MDTISEKPLVFWLKTENQMLRKRKTANRNRHQTRKTEVLRCKNRKTDLKNGRNRKSQRLLFKLAVFPLDKIRYFCSCLFFIQFRLLNTFTNFPNKTVLFTPLCVTHRGTQFKTVTSHRSYNKRS